MNVGFDINKAKAEHDRSSAEWMAQCERERAGKSHAVTVRHSVKLMRRRKLVLRRSAKA